MSGYVAGLCYEVKFGCPTTKAVACALADNAWNDGTKAFPSVKLLSEKCEVSPRTIQRALRRLEEMGVLVVVRAGGSGPRDTREWKFDLHLLRTVAATETKRIIPDDKGDTVSPLDDELRVTPVTPKGDTHDAKGDTGVTRPFINHQEPRTAHLVPDSDLAPASGQIDESIWKERGKAILRIKPGEHAWTRWIDHLTARKEERLVERMVAAGEIHATTRFPEEATPYPKIGKVLA